METLLEFEGESSWKTKKWTKGSNECQTSVRLHVKVHEKVVQSPSSNGNWRKVHVKLVSIYVWVLGIWVGRDIFFQNSKRACFDQQVNRVNERNWGKVCLALAHSVVSTEKQINFRACLLTFLYCVFSNIVKLRKSRLMVLARWVVSPSVPMQTCFTANGATCSGLIQNVEEIQNSLHKPEIWSLIYTKGSQTDQY